MSAPSCHGLGDMPWDGDVPWEGTCCGGDVLGGGWVSELSLATRVQPCWLCPGWARSTTEVGAPCRGGWSLVLPMRPHLPPHPISLFGFTGGSSFPTEVPRHCHSLFRWEMSPSPLSTLQKKKHQERSEINKQIPSLSWLGICSQPFHY